MTVTPSKKIIRKPSLIREYWCQPKPELTIAEKFALYCEEHPWDVECKIYEDQKEKHN